MIMVSGFTHLTGSGLSITQWKPILGAIPPMNMQAWLAEFELYQKIPQFHHVNSMMKLWDLNLGHFPRFKKILADEGVSV
jgi:heme a synthase